MEILMLGLFIGGISILLLNFSIPPEETTTIKYEHYERIEETWDKETE